MTGLSRTVDRLLQTEQRADATRWFVLAAVCVWGVISVLAVITRSPEFFSRAGAVGTGLVLASFALVATVRSAYHTLLEKGLILVLRQHLRDQEGRPLVFEVGLAPIPDPEQAVRDYDHSLEMLGRLFARLDRRSSPARGAEVLAAVVATLQWGYGDLVLNWVMVCGAWKC